MFGKISSVSADALMGLLAPSDQPLGRRHGKLISDAKVVKGLKPQNRMAQSNNELCRPEKLIVVVEREIDFQVSGTFDAHS
jgi:hypothetical protein